MLLKTALYLKKIYTEKTAAPRWVKAFQAGKLPLSSVEGMSKSLNLAPRQLKELGGGMEGIAHLMSSPQHGSMVRKVYDTNGPFYTYLPEKIKMLEKLQGPQFPKYYGKHPTVPSTYHEFVQGTPLHGASISDYAKALPSLIDAQTASFKQTGHYLKDTMFNPGNVMITPQGPKIIDFLSQRPLLMKTPRMKKFWELLTGGRLNSRSFKNLMTAAPVSHAGLLKKTFGANNANLT